ncbi:MAG: cytidylate kinase-like family protein [Treponemataceae bacterium]|nr:cytidylate kinase-like family protein [Treponemataceae bacterium]
MNTIITIGRELGSGGRTIGKLIASKLGMGMSYGFSNKGLPLFDQIYIAQTKVINELADKGSCVIVGRCADYILKERKNLLRVFIYSDMEHRIERAVQLYGMLQQTAQKEIQKSDKERARHYTIFTDKTWGERAKYDLLLNSGSIGVEKCADLICDMAAQTETAWRKA